MSDTVDRSSAPAQPDFKPLFSWRSAVCESNLKATTRHVLLTLSLHMNERGGSCFPSVDTLAAETSLNRATVIRQLQIAEATGWLHVTRSVGRTSNRYEAVVPPKLEPSCKTTVAENDGRTERPSQKTTVAEDATNRRSDEAQPSFSVHPTVAESDPSSSVVLQKNSPRGRHSLAVASAPARRQPDHAFDALAEVTGTDVAGLTHTARGALNKALAEIRGAWSGTPDALPAEIRLRATRYLTQMGDCRITATALAKHWSTLNEQSERLQSGKHRRRVVAIADPEMLSLVEKYAR